MDKSNFKFDDSSSHEGATNETMVTMNQNGGFSNGTLRGRPNAVGASIDSQNRPLIGDDMDEKKKMMMMHGEQGYYMQTPSLVCRDPCEKKYLACNHTMLNPMANFQTFFLFFGIVLVSTLSHTLHYSLIATFIDPAADNLNRFLFAIAVAGNLFAHLHAVAGYTGAYFNIWYSVGAVLLYVIQKATGANDSEEAEETTWGMEVFKALPLALGRFGGIVLGVVAFLALLSPIPPTSTYGGLVLGMDDFTANAPGPLALYNIFAITAFVAAIESMAYYFAYSRGGLAGNAFAGSLLISSTVFLTKLQFGPYTQGLTATLFWLVTGFWRNAYPAVISMIFAPLVGVIITVILYIVFTALAKALCKDDRCPVPSKKN